MEPGATESSTPPSICTRAERIVLLALGLAALLLVFAPILIEWKSTRIFPGVSWIIGNLWPQFVAILSLAIGARFLSVSIKHHILNRSEALGRMIPESMHEGKNLSPAAAPFAEFLPLVQQLNQSGIFHSLHDAETKAAQREQAAQTSVRQVLNSVSDAVLLMDSAHRIIWGNRRVDPVLGGGRHSLIGKPAETLAPDEDARLDLETRLLLAWNGEPQLFEWSCRRPLDGIAFASEVYLERVNLPGADILCLSLHDLSKRKEDERALREALDELKIAKDGAENATHHKSLFLARMTHEIRTPMQAIIGISHLAQRNAKSAEDAGEFRRIHLAGQRLLRIINDILDFSKLEAGKVDLEIKPFSLEELIHSLKDLLSLRLLGKNIHLEMKCDPKIPAHVRGDSLRLHQILLNLLDNALKFTQEGEVALQILPSSKSGCLRFEIQDQGIGLTAEQQARLFQSYEQAEAGTARKFGGTGLGLSICQKLTEVMGGCIGVVSSPGEGSTFWVELPLTAVPPEEWNAARVAHHLSNSELTGKRILVVDDNEINCEIARGLLSELGCVVLIAEGGAEALDLLGNNPIDLVLVDLEMPGMDGFTLTKEIRSSRIGSRLPLVAMTAHVMGETRPLAAAAGLNGYLTKPIDFELLQAELLRFLAPAKSKEPLSPDPNRISPSSGLHIVDAGSNDAPGHSRPPASPSEIIVDVAFALKLLGGNEEIFHFLARRFCESWVNVREQFASAADFQTKRRLAHTLKGICASLGCQQVSELCAGLEKLYHAESEPDSALLEDLFQHIESLRQWLEKNVTWN